MSAPLKYTYYIMKVVSVLFIFDTSCQAIFKDPDSPRELFSIEYLKLLTLFLISIAFTELCPWAASALLKELVFLIPLLPVRARLEHSIQQQQQHSVHEGSLSQQQHLANTAQERNSQPKAAPQQPTGAPSRGVQSRSPKVRPNTKQRNQRKQGQLQGQATQKVQQQVQPRNSADAQLEEHEQQEAAVATVVEDQDAITACWETAFYLPELDAVSEFNPNLHPSFVPASVPQPTRSQSERAPSPNHRDSAIKPVPADSVRSGGSAHLPGPPPDPKNLARSKRRENPNPFFSALTEAGVRRTSALAAVDEKARDEKTADSHDVAVSG